MKTLLTRALSAIVGLLLLSAILFWGGSTGIQILGLICVLLISREGTRILFPQTSADSAAVLVFTLLNVALYLAGVFYFENLAVTFGAIVATFFAVTLFLQKQFTDLDHLFRFQSRAVLGFVYLALFPVFAIRLAAFDQGMIWFISLLAFVFAGDTFAYLVGSRWGKRRLMPAVSPKKSFEGSLGGLFGSSIAAICLHPFLNHVPLFTLIGLALIVGMAGQLGDLFESLLKRVANQKDSGSLMPGHGGALDRIDGVIFAAPFMLAGVSLLENWF